MILPALAELSLGSMEGLKGVIGGQESVISSKWARDDDINRMIRWVWLHWIIFAPQFSVEMIL